MNPPGPPRFTYIDTDSALDALVKQMESAPRVALDTEADSLYHYFEKACLIQLSMNSEHFIVDPLADIDLSRFLNNLTHKDLILHGADYDLRLLKSDFDFRPHAQVFDTMLAAQLLGYDQLGLAALVERFLEVVLPKQKKKSDWSRRPLSPEQQDYASNDTRYLEPLADLFSDALHDRGREGWHREWCEWVIQATQREKPPPDPNREWRLKGMRNLRRRELAFVREIWYWREGAARAADRPPFKIMGNQQIIEIAHWAAAHQKAPLEAGPKLPRHIRGRRLDALKKAIMQARNTPAEHLPVHLEGHRPEPPSPELNALREACARVAQDLNISPSVLASRAAMEVVTKRQPRSIEETMECGPMMRWQAELIQPEIERVLGKRA